MREIFDFTKALRALADGKVLMNSHTQPLIHRIKDGKYEVNAYDSWYVQPSFLIEDAEIRAEWWEVELKHKWKEAKWWEAANVLISFPNEGYVQSYGSILKEWIALKEEDLDLSVLEFSILKLRIRDFESEDKR